MTDKIIDQAATTAGRDLLEALVLELRMLPKPWPQLVKHDQEEIIHRLRSRVTAAVQAAVHTIASEDRVVADATLTKVTFKGGIKAEFELSRTCAARHDLADAEGKLCLIVLADAARHLEGVEAVRGEEDQRAMDLGHEYKPNSDGEGMPGQAEDPPAPPAPPAPPLLENGPTKEERERFYWEGHRAAVAGQPKSDAPHTAWELVAEWTQGWVDGKAAPTAGADDQVVEGQATETAGDQPEQDQPEPPAAMKPSKATPVKYRNLETGSTWTGRGLKPKWLRAKLDAGAKLEDYLVD